MPVDLARYRQQLHWPTSSGRRDERDVIGSKHVESVVSLAHRGVLSVGVKAYLTRMPAGSVFWLTTTLSELPTRVGVARLHRVGNPLRTCWGCLGVGSAVVARGGRLRARPCCTGRCSPCRPAQGAPDVLNASSEAPAVVFEPQRAAGISALAASGFIPSGW